MKILCLRKSKGSGSTWHRLWLPLSKLDAHFTDKLTEDLVSKYDSLWFHYKCDIHPTQLSLWRLKYGTQIVLDVDDTWTIPLNHPSYEIVKRSAEYSKQFAIVADWIVCSTKEVEEMVKPYNENTIVIPNRIPYGEGQYHVRQESLESFMNRKIRIGFCGSVSHMEDWLSIIGKLKRIMSDSEIKQKCEFVICGVPDLEKMSKPNWISEKATQLMRQKGLPELHRDKIESNIFESFKKQNRETWSKITSVMGKPIIKYSRPVEDYIDLYREIDILLCPLVDNDLNKKKSALKVLEAACTDTLCILGKMYDGKDQVCDLYPMEDWYNNIKRLIRNKEDLYEMKLDISEKVRILYDYTNDCVQPRQSILGIKKKLDLDIYGITYKDGQVTEYQEYRNTVNSVEEKSYFFESNVLKKLFNHD